MTILTTLELAERLRLKPNSVAKAAREGRFGTAAQRAEDGAWRFTWPEAGAEYSSRTDPTRVGLERQGGTASPDVSGLRTAVERKNHFDAELKLLKLKEAAGELINAAAVTKKQIEVYANVRSRLLAIPTNMKQRSPETPLATVLLVEKLIHEALTELSS